MKSSACQCTLQPETPKFFKVFFIIIKWKFNLCNSQQSRDLLTLIWFMNFALVDPFWLIKLDTGFSNLLWSWEHMATYGRKHCCWFLGGFNQLMNVPGIVPSSVTNKQTNKQRQAFLIKWSLSILSLDKLTKMFEDMDLPS